MKLSKILFISIFLGIHFWLLAITIEVKQDGSADFTIIQEAINSSSNGDIVLVHPGTYYENIDLNGHDINLCSLEATTGDSSYIASTILDGNQSGSCIKILSGETVTIQGFSITNGSGTFSGHEHRGGGIYTNISNVTMISCIIQNNNAIVAGGAYFRYSNVQLSDVQIVNNFAKVNGGGVVFGGETSVIFDEENRCSIYNNHATSYQDIMMEDIRENMNIILDKVSFANPDGYYIGLKEVYYYTFTLDYQSCANEYIDADLYVAPWGSDDNSGLTPEAPLQNINYATYYIKSDSLNPKTIHMLPGTYTPENQEFFISLKSDLILQGSGRNNTIVDGMELDDVTTFIAFCTNNIFIKDITFTNCTESTINSGRYCGDICLENLILNNGTGQHFGGIKFSGVSTIDISNIEISNCHSSRETSIYIENSISTFIDKLHSYNNYCTIGNGNNGGNGVNVIRVRDDFVLTNSVFDNNQNLYYDDFFDYAGTSSLTIGNAYNADFINSWRIENCLFYENEALQNYECADGFTLTATTATNKGYFLNNTVVNNKGMRTMFLGGLDTYVYNNVFYNDNIISEEENGYELFVPNTFQLMFHSTITFSNNIIKNGFEGYYDDYPEWNEETWLNDPIDLDPMLYSLDDEYPYFPLDNSPVIDAGTNELPDGLTLPEYDLAGNPRIVGNGIDIGCYEWIDGFVTAEEMLETNKAKLSNYPNPFNPCTTISYNLVADSQVELTVYNVKGQKVKTLLNEKMSKGQHSTTWDGLNENNNPMSSGVYLYKVKTENQESVKRMILLK